MLFASIGTQRWYLGHMDEFDRLCSDLKYSATGLQSELDVFGQQGGGLAVEIAVWT